MTAVNFVYFDQFHEDRWKKLHDVDGDTVKVALVTSVLALVTTLADPRWGAGGSNNLSTNEVSAGTSYTAGGEDGGGAIIRVGSKITFDLANNISWDIDATGFTNARYFVAYNNTDAGKRAVGFGDFGSNQSIQVVGLALTWHASGLSEEDDV